VHKGGVEVQFYSLFNLGVGWPRHGIDHALVTYPWVPIVQKALWDPGLVWKGVENLTLPVFNPQTVQFATSYIPVCRDKI